MTRNSTVPTTPGTPFEGGFYAGCFSIDSDVYVNIVSPKLPGEFRGVWHPKRAEVPAGARSYADGLANTIAMAEAGSEMAQWMRDLRIGGHDDWHLGALDQYELAYRLLKPTQEKNYCWARSGINLSAMPPTFPYTRELPLQTPAEAFQAGGAEAFDPAWYWTSTQYAAHSDYAWMQDFDDGVQYYDSKGCSYRARAFRRLKI